jgi:hypothetical protein
MHQLLPRVASSILCVIVWTATYHGAAAQTTPQIEWAQYLPDSVSTSITSDTLGNVYMSGHNLLPGAFLAKFDSAGHLLWQQQWGERGLNPLRATTDGMGDIYITGEYVTPMTYQEYAILTKFDKAGDFKWMQQISLGNGALGQGVAADAIGNVYLSGSFSVANPWDPFYSTGHGFIARFNSDGGQQWLQMFGDNKSVDIESITTDRQGNVYFAGSTNGSLYGTNAGDWDIINGKLDSNGTLTWAKQFGTDKEDIARAISFSPEGNLYMLGNTNGDLAGDVTPYDDDAFVRKYDLSGHELWTRQLDMGTSYGADLTTDGAGGVFLTGMTWPASGVTDGWAAKYDDLGNLKWTTTFGSNNLFDDAYGITAQTPFGIFISGSTSTTGSPRDINAFVVKLVETPEPGIGCLTTMAVIFAAAFHRHRGNAKSICLA